MLERGLHDRGGGRPGARRGGDDQGRDPASKPRPSCRDPLAEGEGAVERSRVLRAGEIGAPPSHHLGQAVGRPTATRRDASLPPRRRPCRPCPGGRWPAAVPARSSLTAARSGSAKVRMSSAHGPRNIRHSSDVAVTSHAIRQSACSKVCRMRAGRLEDPGALDGEGVEGDEQQMERREQLADGARLAIQRGKQQIRRGVTGHDARKYRSGLAGSRNRRGGRRSAPTTTGATVRPWASTVTFYKILLFLHVLCVIAGFGSVGWNAVHVGPGPARDGAGGADPVDFNPGISRVAEFVIYAVFILGLLVVATSRSHVEVRPELAVGFDGPLHRRPRCPARADPAAARSSTARWRPTSSASTAAAGGHRRRWPVLERLQQRIAARMGDLRRHRPSSCCG